MVQLGQMNHLPIVELDAKGAWLDVGDYGELFLPRRHVPQEAEVGQTLAVFVYLNGDGEAEISGDAPLARLGEFAALRVVSASKIGAFLDWGLKKDLFVPIREQAETMQVGRHYLVRLFLDEQGRVAATSKLERFLRTDLPPYQAGDKVRLIIGAHTPMGFKAIVDEHYTGMLFRNEVFTRLPVGRRLTGYVKQVREDGKLDLSLQAPGETGREAVGDKILARLRKQQGFLPVSDTSAPELISNLFGISKGQFKKAIGGLYKQGLIVIEDEGIRLTEAGQAADE